MTKATKVPQNGGQRVKASCTSNLTLPSRMQCSRAPMLLVHGMLQPPNRKSLHATQTLSPQLSTANPSCQLSVTLEKLAPLLQRNRQASSATIFPGCSPSPRQRGKRHSSSLQHLAPHTTLMPYVKVPGKNSFGRRLKTSNMAKNAHLRLSVASYFGALGGGLPDAWWAAGACTDSESQGL